MQRFDRSRWWIGAICLFGLGVSSFRGKSGISENPRVEAKGGVAGAVVAPVPGQVQARVDTDEERSCRGFVQGFYYWYLKPVPEDKQHTFGQLDMDDVVRRRPGVLARELYADLKADRVAQAHAPDLVGLDFDAFTGSQDNSLKFEVKSVSVNDANCLATVWGVDQGAHRETVEPESKYLNGKWAFVDFRYLDDGSDLMEQLKVLGRDRENGAKKRDAHR